MIEPLNNVLTVEEAIRASNGEPLETSDGSGESGGTTTTDFTLFIMSELDITYDVIDKIYYLTGYGDEDYTYLTFEQSSETIDAENFKFAVLVHNAPIGCIPIIYITNNYAPSGDINYIILDNDNNIEYPLTTEKALPMPLTNTHIIGYGAIVGI